MKDRKRLIQILIPVCIVIVIAGIWIFKNINDGEDFLSPPENKGSGNLVSPKNDDDFVLEAKAIDLEALTSYELPIIIDFGADSCEACKNMAPVLKAVNADMQGKAIIKFVDVWKNGEAVGQFPIQLIPTQVFINADGTPYVPDKNVDIEFTMYSYNDTGEHAYTVHQGGLTEEEMRLILEDMGVEQ